MFSRVFCLLIVFCHFLEIFRTYEADRTLLRSCFTFMDVSAYETYIFLCHNFDYFDVSNLILKNSKLFLMQRYEKN